MRLTLLLLVLGVFADNHNSTFSLDDFAFFANLLDGRLNFHCLSSFRYLSFHFMKTVWLFSSPGDTSLCEVIDRDLDSYLISRKYSDIVHSELARYVRGHYMTVGKLNAEGGVRQCLNYYTFKLDHIILCQE